MSTKQGYYIAAAHWRSPKTIGADVLSLRMFWGVMVDGLDTETIVRARVLSEDPRAMDIMVVQSSGDSLLKRIKALLSGENQ